MVENLKKKKANLKTLFSIIFIPSMQLPIEK